MTPAPRDHSNDLRERVADMLAENDAAGTGPVSRGEYLADADALLGLVGGEVELLRASLADVLEMAEGAGGGA